MQRNTSQANSHQNGDRISEHSPVRQQYLGVKRQHPDALLFFRMGDFYEMFDDDAELAARELEITLTRRDWGRGERTAMAGIPHHAADGYIARLIAKGYRVAVCEQVSDPALSKGLVERAVIRVVTPGTIVDPTMLAAKRNNYLAAAVLSRDAVGIAYADITTGEFACTQFSATQPEIALIQELARVQPAEVLIEATAPRRMALPRTSPPNPLSYEERGSRERVWFPLPWGGAREGDEPESLAGRLTGLDGRLPTVVTPFDARNFREDVARERLREQFGVASLEAFGCERLPLAIRAAGAVVAYLRETQRDTLAQMAALETYSVSGFMTLDAHTRRNLELFESGRSGSVKGSLLWVLDATATPMGGRLLRRWLAEPLLDLERLRRRQDAVAAGVADIALRARLMPLLSRMGDLERLINRVVQRIAMPRDLVALAQGFAAVDELATMIPRTHRRNDQEEDSLEAPLPVGEGLGRGSLPAGLAAVAQALQPLPELRALVERALVDEPPATLADGGFIRGGYSAELDTLLDASRNGRQWVADLERRERERSGISTLRVGYNKVFGYYLEITNSQLSRVPDDYIRKQTITTGERFITPDLKEYEALILNAQEKGAKLEQELFAALRAEIAARWGESPCGRRASWPS